ncbi:MAG: metal-dependent transcriptional regulator [Sphaerochaetaceae bacterium]
MVLREAGEMYLETILIIGQRQETVRSIDIARQMGYSKPTISEQMKRLRENGYLKMDEQGLITLTGKGKKIAEGIYDRHKVISKILINLGVSEKTATEDACRIEHYISQETFDCMKKNYEKAKTTG